MIYRSHQTRPRRLRRVAVIAALAVTVVILAARTDRHTTHAPPTRPGSGAALRQLATLRVVPARPHHSGYQRGCGSGLACSFGSAWTDDTSAPGGHNGCDTRNDILAAQLTAVRLRPGSRCVVIAGVLHDPYTGHIITFAKQHAAAVQIDHIVPLALAWDLGAYAWPSPQRAAFANDERLELLAVSGTANDAKGDSGPGDWMPAHDPASYAERCVAVLAHYRLPVIAADKAALTAALKRRSLVSIYVDNARVPGRWYSTTAFCSHLTADTRDELHAFAERIGLRRSWFYDEPDGRWRYEVTASRRWEAIAAGAQDVTTDELTDVYRRRGRARRW
jgi:hypothetical protein